MYTINSFFEMFILILKELPCLLDSKNSWANLKTFLYLKLFAKNFLIKREKEGFSTWPSNFDFLQTDAVVLQRLMVCKSYGKFWQFWTCRNSPVKYFLILFDICSDLKFIFFSNKQLIFIRWNLTVLLFSLSQLMS